MTFQDSGTANLLPRSREYLLRCICVFLRRSAVPLSAVFCCCCSELRASKREKIRFPRTAGFALGLKWVKNRVFWDAFVDEQASQNATRFTEGLSAPNRGVRALNRGVCACRACVDVCV